jgi:RNA polymerase sigma-70 factor (ECF subfamily)
LIGFETSFRREYVRLSATLTARFGIEHREDAEDAVQHAFWVAMRSWPTQGIPPDQSRWLHRVALQQMIDTWRRGRKQVPLNEETYQGFEPSYEADVSDDEIRMLILSCHPALDESSQICLMLQVACGLNASEIAHGLLQKESAVAQRLVRAKRKLRGLGVSFDEAPDLERNGRQVLRTLYLLFNEGYVCSSGQDLTHVDLCEEAFDLLNRLIESCAWRDPAASALAALMSFHSSRFPARSRIDDSSDNLELVTLEEQDRSLWNHERIAMGFRWLSDSCRGVEITPYHSEAAIAACHASAPSFAQTDWSAVRTHYDDLLRVHPSLIGQLNACVATAMLHGAEAGILEFEDLRPMPENHHYYAVRAWLAEKLGKYADAVGNLKIALELTSNAAEMRFISAWMIRLLVSQKVPDAGNSEH